MQVNSRTRAPGQCTRVYSDLALPGVSGSAWRIPPPLLPSSSALWPSKWGQNHLVSHSYWRTSCLGLDAFLDQTLLLLP